MGNERAVERLIELGANMNCTTDAWKTDSVYGKSSGQTPLHWVTLFMKRLMNKNQSGLLLKSFCWGRNFFSRQCLQTICYFVKLFFFKRRRQMGI